MFVGLALGKQKWLKWWLVDRSYELDLMLENIVVKPGSVQALSLFTVEKKY